MATATATGPVWDEDERLWYCPQCLADTPEGKPCPVCPPGAPDEMEAQTVGIGSMIVREGVRAATRQPTHAPPADISSAARAIRKTRGTVAVKDAGLLTGTVRAPAATREAPIDGARVLNQVYGYLGHMGVWPSGWAQVTATLYAAAAHAKDEDTKLPVWQYMPRLFYTSRQGGSGKSWLARQSAALCPDGKSLVEMTKASLVDLIYKHCTIVITELDIAVGSGRRMQWLTGLANAGYEPDHMTARKHGGEVLEIPTFGPMILDGLDKVIFSTGESLKTLMSRCIIVRVERAPEGYRPPRFDREKRAIAAALNGRLARWMAQEVAEGIGDVVPEVPEGLGNRPAALWEPLFAVADAAGGDLWPALARAACERIESATGLPGEDEQAAAEIDGALDSWGVMEPMWPEAQEG